MYDIASGDTTLRLLTRENLNELKSLYLQDEFIRSSLVYNALFNLSFASRQMEEFLGREVFVDANRFYFIEESGSQQPAGLCGLFDIHWIQRRAELILLMGEGQRKQKKFYAPLKALLRLACTQWKLRLFTCKIFSTDTATLTMLKAFGFQVNGEIEEYGREGPDFFNVTLLSLKASDFRSVDV